MYTCIQANICMCIPVSKLIFVSVYLGIQANICICIHVSKLIFVSVEVSADEFEDELECISALQTLKNWYLNIFYRGLVHHHSPSPNFKIYFNTMYCLVVSVFKYPDYY